MSEAKGVEQVEHYEQHAHRHREDDEVSVRSEALGDDLPEGYFWSIQFIGMVTVSKLECYLCLRLKY